MHRPIALAHMETIPLVYQGGSEWSPTISRDMEMAEASLTPEGELRSMYVLHSTKSVSNGQPGEPNRHNEEGGRHGTHWA